MQYIENQTLHEGRVIVFLNVIHYEFMLNMTIACSFVPDVLSVRNVVVLQLGIPLKSSGLMGLLCAQCVERTGI